MKTKIESHVSPFFFISLLSLVPSLVVGAGLAAIKEQSFHQDAGANIVVYSKLMHSGISVNIETKTRTFTIEPKRLAGNVELLTVLPANILTDSELEPIRKSAKEYREFSIRFPKSIPILNPQLTALEECIKKFESGTVRYNGQWMAKENALAEIDKKEHSGELAEAELKRKQEERKLFEKSQKEKGLANYNGQWIPEDEARKLVARDAEAATKYAQEKAIVAASNDAVLKIMQSDDNGVLCKVAFFKNKEFTVTSADSLGRRVKTTKTGFVLEALSEESVYVTGVSGVVDGAMVRANLISTGKIHQYQSVLGARISVAEYMVVGGIKSYSGFFPGPREYIPAPRASSLQSVGGGG